MQGRGQGEETLGGRTERGGQHGRDVCSGAMVIARCLKEGQV